MSKLRYKEDGIWKSIAPSQKEFDDNKNEVAQQLVETNDYIFSDGKSLLKSLSDTGEGIRYVAIGDSIIAGVGQTSAGAYGETNDITRKYSAQSLFAVSLIKNDPRFIKVDKTVYPVSEANAGAVPAPLDSHQLIYTVNPSLTYTLSQHLIDLKNEVTVYYLERTSMGAGTVDVEITSGGVTTTTVLDTYAPKVTYNGTSTSVDRRLAALTIPIPGTTKTPVTIKLKNMQIPVRTEGTPTDGTVVILGFAFGNGVRFRNYAVSSTTLLNNSAINTTRGVTTTERLQKAYDFGANVISLGWGTNDSKVGINTVETFETDLKQRIDEIRAFKPKMVIILSTAPKGAIGSVYENNILYNSVIRKVAIAKNVYLIDVERIFAGYTGDVYADEVHPNGKGYRVISSAICDMFKLKYFALKENASSSTDVVPASAKYVSKIIAGGLTNATATLLLVDEVVFNMPVGATAFSIQSKLNIVSAADANSVTFELRVEGFSELGATGTASAEATKDKTIVSLFGSGVTPRIKNVFLHDVHLGTNKSYKIKVYGANYQLRSASAQSSIIVTLIG